MSQTPKKGLGRGINTLISQDFDKSLLLTADDRIEKIPVGELQPNPQQPRRNFDEKTLQELAASIKQHGIVQPLVVMPAKGGSYTLIAGERRWRAAQLAGLKTVPAILRNSKELEQLEIALIENVQRVDLSPLETAVSIERLHEQFSMTHAEIAKRLGKATTTVVNTGRLLKLPANARDALAAGKITEGHARSILALKDHPEQQDYLLDTIIKQGWTVRQAERFVVSVKDGIKESVKAHARTERETPATRRLSTIIGRPVTIYRSAKGGRLELGFKTDEELEALMAALEKLS